MKLYILSEVNWKEVKDTQFELAILTWCASEVYYYHISHSADILESEYIVTGSVRITWESCAK